MSKCQPMLKIKRVVDPAGMKKVKMIDRCERCNRPADGYCVLEVAHVISKGAGGPDIKENCLKLCGPACMGAGCHGLDHKGEISNDELFGIIAVREGKPVEEIRDITHKAWRFGEYEPG